MQFAVCDADLRSTGSTNEVFPATHKSGRRHGMAEFTTSLKSTPSTRAAREGACEREHVGQHVDSDAGKPWSAMVSDSWSAMKIATGSWSAMTTAREQRKALDKPRHHTAKDGVYGARGARLTHSQNSDAGEQTQLKVKSRNTNRGMILKRS